MENIIFYFTGTGNSLKTAKSIAEGLGNAELIRITNRLKLSDKPIKCRRKSSI
jgi:flavodoxin